MKIPSIILALAVLAFGAHAAAEDIPAKRTDARGPAYPASCRPPVGEEHTVDIVTVSYTVTKKGLPQSVRIQESTNDCFNETAISAIRRSDFDPRRVNGEAVDQEDVETTFIFRFEKETAAEEFDARPVVRKPPLYPQKCMGNAHYREEVLVEFDVNEKGDTENVRVLDASLECFNGSSIDAVKKWKYSPKTIEGEPTYRRGVQTIIIYVLKGATGGETSPEDRIRPLVLRNFLRAQTMIKKQAYQQALDKLAEIESRFGDTFSKGETTTFHQMRGAARLGLHDYAGALDDLRIARRGNLSSQTTDSIDETILQLIKIVEAQDASEVASENGGASQE